MTTYQITSSAGADLGTYEGATPAEALDAMCRDAGYKSAADAVTSGIAPFEGTVTETSAPATNVPPTDETATYALCYGNGQTESYDTYEDARAAYLASRTHGTIGHDGDISQGGERTLCWPSEELSENDDGSRADASIRVRHALGGAS